jgi:3-methyl-2-oxobutanoate hydroxymethyltransferase
MNKVTLTTLQQLKRDGEKIASLTAYDASFAQVGEEAGVEVLLVGDSLGMVLQGQDSTLPVTVADMAYHTRCVRAGAKRPLLVVDMPFMSYADPQQALRSAATLMRAGAHVVKLEGSAWLEETIQALTRHGIPVCGHLGLLPQSVNLLGGYRVQGRDAEQAHDLMNAAFALQEAGARLLVLECIPATLGQEISRAIEIPVIGIGAGPDCDGQVLVLQDLLGITPGRAPAFSKDFLGGNPNGIRGAIGAYVEAVKNGSFPAPEHCFK